MKKKAKHEPRATSHEPRKMWGGRFKAKTHPLMEKFSASVHFDARLASYDIRSSIAHAKMLAHCKIIRAQDERRIVDGLNRILERVRGGKFVWDKKLEDVHTNIEAALRGEIGEAADLLHAARSRNDQVATDLKMYLRQETKTLSDRVRIFQRAILKLAKRYSRAIIPGYTHLQRAQAVLVAHHLAAYLEMLERDWERLGQAWQSMGSLPLGACALSGTTFQTDRNFLLKELSPWFDRLAPNSLDAVSDRDFVLEAASALAILGVHLSRISEEMILWSSFEFGFIELTDEFATGSSAMPQKKNPDVFELTRGKSGRLIGHLTGLLTMMKALPLSYNRDMQEDKEAIFDAVDTAKAMLEILSAMFPGIRIREHRLGREEDFTSSLDLAEYLVKKGLPFRQAHEVMGQIVRHCLEKDKSLKDLSLEEVKRFSGAFEADFKDILGWEASVSAKKSFGSTNPGLVAKALKEWERRLGHYSQLPTDCSELLTPNS